MKKALICLSIVAIVVLCTLNVATASTGNYSTTIQNSAQHTRDHTLKARGSTSNGILNWKYATKNIVTSSATTNGIVYVGSGDNKVYAPRCEYGGESVELYDRILCDVLSHRLQWDRLRRELGS